MTRRITRYNQLALSDWAIKDVTENMIEQSKLAQAILGVVTSIDGFNCTPTVSPSMSVQLSAITLLAYEAVDTTPFGDTPSQLPANSNQILKLAYNQTPSVAAFVAPGTVGFSRNDLIQVTFSEQDDTPDSVPFYNPADPTNPIFQTVNTLRSDSVSINVKAGVAAATGTQATPAPDAGKVGAWVVTTTNGVSTITSGNIAQYVSSPSVFLTEKLQDKISLATADARYAQNSVVQSGILTYSLDTGAANTYIATLSPALTAYAAGLEINLKIANPNTGASTVNVNALGVKNIKRINGAALLPGDLITGMEAKLFYDGTNFQLLNPAYGLNSNPAASGYTYLPGGLLLQWGEGASQNQSIQQTITFPIAFPNAVNQVIISAKGIFAGASTITDSFFYVDGTPTLTDFVCARGENSGSAVHPLTPTYFAIGN